jgi:endonuclease/exonuclease/phosphatase family metal-dependent hydrolase
MIRAALAAALALGCAGAPSETDTFDDAPAEPAQVRVVTWNVQTLGRAGTPQHTAAGAVLARLDADLVLLNELEETDRGALDELAAQLGYPTAFVPDDNPFGELRNGLLTRLPGVDLRAPPAAVLAADNRANDQTRLPLVATITLAGIVPVTVVGQHLKSGFSEEDRFRRTIDAFRAADAAGAEGARALLGDLNADLGDMPESPTPFVRVPAGMPSAWRLGADLDARLRDGIPSDPSAPLRDVGLLPLDARQLDGRTETRPASGRRIDWALTTADLADAARAEVYDCLDEGRDGLPKPGPVPPRTACADASDHLPIVVDLLLPPLGAP